MNTIIPTKINFEELVKTNSELSVDCQSKLISTINQEFTETEKEWYVYNLFMYLNYHPTKDYPVNLEDLYKTIGFANKGNAMKTIKNNFTEGEDYKTSFLPKEKSSWGGSGREQIMLNTETFKFLCLLAKTEKGKEIRKYYVKLETIYNMLVKEQFEIAQKLIKEKEKKELELKNQLLQNQEIIDYQKKERIYLEKELEEKSQKIRVLTKKTNKFKLGECVYVFKSNHENKNIYKIGRTKNCNEREYNHKTATFDGEIIYQVMCANSTILERVCHHFLDEYKIASKREWFLSDFSTIKNAVDIAQCLVDSKIDFKMVNIVQDIKKIIKNISRNEIQKSINIEENNTNTNTNTGDIANSNITWLQQQENYENKDELKDESNEPPDEHFKFTNLNIIDYTSDKNDFEKFLNNCCESDINSTVSHIELKNQYKIWAKVANYDQMKKMITYVKTKYKTIFKRYNPLVVTSKMTETFSGLKIKDKSYQFEEPEDVNCIIENYLYINCQRAPGYRVTMQEIFQDFELFFKQKYNYQDNLTYDIKEKVKKYFDIMFIRLRKGQSNTKVDTRLGGWLGVALKNNNTPEPILNYNPINRKSVSAVKINTSEIIKQWPSIRDVSDFLHKSTSVTSGLIKRHSYIEIDNIKCFLSYTSDVTSDVQL